MRRAAAAGLALGILLLLGLRFYRRPAPVDPSPPLRIESVSPGEPSYKRASALVAAQKCAEAIPELDEAIRLDPSYSLAYYERGLAKQCLGLNEEGLRDYDQAIRLDPKDPYAYYARGLWHAGEGRIDLARQDLDVLISLNQSNFADNLAGVIHDQVKAKGLIQVEK